MYRHKRRRIIKELNDHASRRQKNAVRIIVTFLRSTKRPVNIIDPITMEALGAHGPYFVLVETSQPGPLPPQHCTFVFEIHALQELVDKTGRLFNPITTRSFDHLQLRRLKRVARSKGHDFNTDFSMQEASSVEAGALVDELLAHFIEILESCLYSARSDWPIAHLADIVAYLLRLDVTYYTDMFDSMDRYAFNSAPDWCLGDLPTDNYPADDWNDLPVFLSLYNLVSQQISQHLTPSQNAARKLRECEGKFSIIALCEAMCSHDEADV
jgi:hypothetical protein